ncbi:MAG: DUF4982 domain-containing protein [Lachnospiraceae bacterium]|nr:DUF4982 domain-containing protein [Lachnospiraceae bacterium]
MRKIISLNDNWKFALHRGFEPMEKTSAESLEYAPVTLPHDWQIASPYNKEMKQGAAQGYSDRWGIGWYQREFVLDEALLFKTRELSDDIEGKKAGNGEEALPDAICRLCFDGVYENSTVWVNDICVGGRKYGYSPFALDITEAVRSGKNQILVKVDNTAQPADRWYSGAGIYRKVYLEILSAVHLERDEVQVLTHVGEEQTELEIYTGTERPVRAVVSLRETDVRKAGDKETVDEDCAGAFQEAEKRGAAEITGARPVYVAEGCGLISLTISEPALWSAEQPTLYDLKLQLLESGDEINSNIAGCGVQDEEQKAENELQNGRQNAQTEATLPADGRVLDELSLKIGLCTVELSPEKGLFINGESVKLKGVCIHQEAGAFGTAVQSEIWRQRLLALKEIGCNALRLAHHLYMPEMLDLCDELGFYVYEECFDKWTGGAYGRYHETEWQQDIDAMVLRDRNRPSILFWGVGNEVENQSYPSMLEILEQHVARVKSLDLTRQVSLAMNPHFTYPTAEKVDMSQVADIQKFVDEAKEGEIYDIDDRVRQIKLIADRVDLISCNYQEQWYDRIHELIPDKAILGTETFMYFRGQDHILQNYSDENPWWDVEKRDYVIGGMIWTGIDYLGESIGYPAKGWSGALFSTDLEKRPIAWVHQSNWTKEPVVRFAVMDYTIPCNWTKEGWDYPRYETHWEFPQFQGVVLPYMIATNCEQVKLFVNEKEFLLKPTAAYPNRTITGCLPYLPGKVTVIGFNGGKEVCRHEVVTPGAAVKLSFEQEEQTISLKKPCAPYEKNGVTEEKEQQTGIVPAEHGQAETAFYQMLLKVRAYDQDDNPVFKESAQVRFTVEGPARIVGVDNGDMQSSEPKTEDRIHLYHGKAAAVLAITGAGRVKVTAYGAGLLEAQTVIDNL